MSHEVTASKYRPQTFDELIGQDFVTSSLKNSLTNNRIANAYLLSGPRGIGKTSAARIIAKALNCQQGPSGNPCNLCENCKSITQGYNNDVIEIDGASNTSINDIRVIQEEILYPPTGSKYKIYIIDEVHMLSKSAFNALLKTIEEPPDYVVFIFATTEVNKVIPTIRSRCQQFNFRLIPSELIFKSLINVLKQNKINYEESAIYWIANEGKGSMRDAYTLLDQVVSFCNSNITLKLIQEKLGLVGEEKISSFVNAIIKQNQKQIFSDYINIIETGITIEQILSELIEYFRNILILKLNLTNNKMIITYNLNFYSNDTIEAFSFEDIENIINILFKTHENCRNSLNTNLEFEICIFKLLKFKDIIRPKELLSDLNKIKNSLLNFKTDKKFKEENTKSDSDQTEINLKKPIIKSEILKIIKSKISSNFQLITALNNIESFEENNNSMILYFIHKMHYDIAKAHESFLTDEAISIIGEKYNKNFKIRIEFKNTQNINTKNSDQNINKQNIKEIFQGKEI